MLRRSFRAMGTDVELLLDAPASHESDSALAAAEAKVVRLEELLSRFRASSELSALNEAGTLRACPDLLAVAALAVAAREETGGRFDPTVHDAVVGAGYDRSFEQLRTAVVQAEGARCGGDVHVDPETGVIRLQDGFRLDLGGIAKGYAADRACDVLAPAGPCLVDLGGDLAARGREWPIGVETPDGMITLSLADGALATSGTDRRRWRTESGEAHHLIDPRTGTPADTDILRVTVVAADAARAEVLAKALLLAGAEQAAREADRLRTPAVLVTTDGATVLAGGLA